MKFAYAIQAHKNSEQIIRLVNRITSDPDSYAFIHIDKKSSHIQYEIENYFKNNNHVKIIQHPITVNWSGLSIVKSSLLLFNTIFKDNTDYDYIHLLSGQDYLIKNHNDIKSFFTKNYGKEFIEYRQIGKYYWRILCYNFFRENPKNKTLKLKVSDNLIRYLQKFIVRRNNFPLHKLYIGSAWFSISYNLVEYILNFIKHNPNYLNKFKYTACADEHFFQILALNSPFKNKIINNNLRFLKWNPRENSPKVLSSTELDELLSSSKLFARKFDMNEDCTILERIDQQIFSNL